MLAKKWDTKCTTQSLGFRVYRPTNKGALPLRRALADGRALAVLP
jgi:hypothetical protein